MKENAPKKLTYADIGYQGKSIDALSRKELLDAYLELAQKVYECAVTDSKCKDVFVINRN